MNNFALIVLDGVGIGELPDANEYGDTGSNTLVNMSKALSGLSLPNLEKLGLGNIENIIGIKPQKNPTASYGKMQEISIGKDSISGHWELGGIDVNFQFPLYPKGFPVDIIKKFLELTGFENIIGNTTASGTEIINQLGDEHCRTGYPIVYTSADSVFQIAAHEEIIPLQRLYEMCKITREKVMIDSHNVGRVIARPFLGENGNYSRTTNRKDFSVDPFSDTILDVLLKSGINTVAIGKINDLFNYRGIKNSIITKSNLEGINEIINSLEKFTDSFIFANLVDFDVYFGHRNDPAGFHNALIEFDSFLPGILSKLDDSDALIITADHGNDPTSESTDHSREYVPLLIYRSNCSGINLRVRSTFSDAAQTVAHFFKVNNNLKGDSFLNE